MVEFNVLLLQLGAAVFAVTGVLAAARQNMDVLSFVIIGVVTAIGGGTLRDLMLDAPVFWLADARYRYVASGAAIATSSSSNASARPTARSSTSTPSPRPCSRSSQPRRR